MAAAAGPRVTFEHGNDLRRLASSRRDRVRFVDVPEARYLVIDGTDVPGSPRYLQAIGALFSAAYRLHFLLKGRGISERVGHLEALYWLPSEVLAADGAAATDAGALSEWRWRLMIAVPEATTQDEVAVAASSSNAGEYAERIGLERWAEGPSAQILHVGSYDAEGPTIEKLHVAIADAGLRAQGPHHEIYLNDPHRVGEERARTVLRQPVAA